jgi:hypothetical protein
MCTDESGMMRKLPRHGEMRQDATAIHRYSNQTGGTISRRDFLKWVHLNLFTAYTIITACSEERCWLA